MSSIEKLLKEHYLQPDAQPVTLTVSTTLGFLRENSDQMQGLDLQSIALAKSASAGQRKQPAAKKKAAKKATKSTKSAKKSTAKTAGKKKAKTVRLSQDMIMEAVKAGNRNAKAIADAINGNQRQISNALSRYLRAGLVERTGPGEYEATGKS